MTRIRGLPQRLTSNLQILPNTPKPRPSRCPATSARTALPKSASGARSGPMPHMPRPRIPPEARRYKKSTGTGANLCFIEHALMENRIGLVVQGDLTQADGRAERRAALDMSHRQSPGSTRQLKLDVDKGNDVAGFVTDLRRARVTPNVVQKSRYSAIDDEPPGTRGMSCRQTPQTDRGSLRLGKYRGWHGANRLSRPRAGPFPLHPDDGSQQPRPSAQAAGQLKRTSGIKHTFNWSESCDSLCRPAQRRGKPFRISD